jgi:predicted transcriptional regulator
MTEELDPASQTVLQLVSEGHNDIQKITEETTLTNSQVNYRFQKLQDLDLIEVEKRDGWTTRVIDGQKRKFKAPKQAELTEHGEQVLQNKEADMDEYRDLTREELVEKIHRLEGRIEDLENKFNTLRSQIRRYLS